MIKETRVQMGMHITVEIVDNGADKEDVNDVYAYFNYIDTIFSTYKDTSEISKINGGKIKDHQYSDDMKFVLRLAEKTKLETQGYFNIFKGNYCDPSGIVKGWAILNAAKLLEEKGFKNYFIDAGGDIQVSGKNSKGDIWTVGIQNPFNQQEIVKVLTIENCGVATSGTALRGQHIYNPHRPNTYLTDIVSITIIGPNVLEADRFATAAFAMGKEGIMFIEKMKDFEGYMIDKNKKATYTSGFERYIKNNIY